MKIQLIKQLQMKQNSNLKEQILSKVLENLEKFDFTHKKEFVMPIEEFLPPPKDIKIAITIDAYLKTMKIVQSCDKEIAWHGTVEKQENTYTITDVFTYPQHITGVTVDANEISYGPWLLSQGERLNTIRMQGHSHVNMAVSPSSTDTLYYKELIEHVNDYYIFLIVNKKNEIHLRFYDLQDNLLYTDIPLTVKTNSNIDLDEWYKEQEKMLTHKTTTLTLKKWPTYNRQESFEDAFDKWYK